MTKKRPFCRSARSGFVSPQQREKRFYSARGDINSHGSGTPKPPQSVISLGIDLMYHHGFQLRTSAYDKYSRFEDLAVKARPHAHSPLAITGFISL